MIIIIQGLNGNHKKFNDYNFSFEYCKVKLATHDITCNSQNIKMITTQNVLSSTMRCFQSEFKHQSYLEPYIIVLTTTFYNEALRRHSSDETSLGQAQVRLPLEVGRHK